MLQTSLLLMKSLNKTETPIFLSVVCSLFPKAIFLTFIPQSNEPKQNKHIQNQYQTLPQTLPQAILQAASQAFLQALTYPQPHTKKQVQDYAKDHNLPQSWIDKISADPSRFER